MTSKNKKRAALIDRHSAVNPFVVMGEYSGAWMVKSAYAPLVAKYGAAQLAKMLKASLRAGTVLQIQNSWNPMSRAQRKKNGRLVPKDGVDWDTAVQAGFNADRIERPALARSAAMSASFGASFRKSSARFGSAIQGAKVEFTIIDDPLPDV